ncbi:hypothetical protein PR001_g25083 [Phytophthora rubi]|uniref:Secreted protein n=1 Tax=Phytophthora rubi TaxID=129364 RepID=A0A6A3ICR7_9STRA|nr:hypothetical protein PR001_g25083 [Phytophthora rubi]
MLAVSWCHPCSNVFRAVIPWCLLNQASGAGHGTDQQDYPGPSRSSIVSNFSSSYPCKSNRYHPVDVFLDEVLVDHTQHKHIHRVPQPPTLVEVDSCNLHARFHQAHGQKLHHDCHESHLGFVVVPHADLL